ncbi:vasculin isoform 2-T2 [Rhinophrynus dorsalis]
MAQHDFAPAWLTFPTPPSSTKVSLSTEKYSESLICPDRSYSVNRRRHNSSDAFEASLGRSNSGNLGRKEKNGWRSQGRNGTVNVNHHGTCNGSGSRSRSSTFHGGKSQGHGENNFSGSVARNEDREKHKQFEAEDFPSLKPEYEQELKQNKSIAAGVWEYPLNTKSRVSRMLIIRKGMKDDFSLSGYPIATSSHIAPVKNRTDVNKGLFKKNFDPPKEQCNSQTKENRLGSAFYQESHECYRKDNSIPADLLGVSESSLKEGDNASSLHNRISTCHERDINLNFDQNEIPQGNGNIFPVQITQSSTFPQADVLSSSLEAEHRLLKEMGWQEDGENDEIYAPLTEDEMREFQTISEQMQKNGVQKKSGLAFDLKFGPWKNNIYNISVENDDTETSSSDTSDDDYV